MTDTTDLTDPIGRLRALRAEQIDRLWPAAQAAAETGDHEQLIELIKIYTAVQAIDFALANRPDPNAETRTRVGF